MNTRAYHRNMIHPTHYSAERSYRHLRPSRRDMRRTETAFYEAWFATMCALIVGLLLVAMQGGAA